MIFICELKNFQKNISQRRLSTTITKFLKDFANAHGALMEDKLSKEQKSRYVEHQKFIEEVHKKAQQAIENEKVRPNSIEEILKNNPKFIKILSKRR